MTEKLAHFTAWQAIIDYKLIEWGRDPEKQRDVGVDPPTKTAVSRAIFWAHAYQLEGLPPPHSVVRDPNGGIAFERRGKDPEGKTAIASLHISADGATEFLYYCDNELIMRKALP